MIAAEEIERDTLACMLATVKADRCPREEDRRLIDHLHDLYNDGARSPLEMLDCFKERLRGLYEQQIEYS